MTFTTKHIHAHFEGEFIKRNLSRSAVAEEVGPYLDCKCTIESQTYALLLTTLVQVEPLYALEKDGDFNHGNKLGIAFAAARLAAGAQATRDMIVDAWLEKLSHGKPYSARDADRVRWVSGFHGNNPVFMQNPTRRTPSCCCWKTPEEPHKRIAVFGTPLATQIGVPIVIET